MILPRRTTYDLGVDRYGRGVELIHEAGNYTLVRKAYSQRDEEARIDLRADQIRALAQVIGQ